MALSGDVLEDRSGPVIPQLSQPDPAMFRQVLSHFPTGVAVVTGRTAQGPLGMAINSFTSLSLEPPMVLFCPAVSSKTWPLLRADSRVAISILSAKQEKVSRAMAGAADQRFAEVDWSAAVNGSPLLAGAIAWLECSIVAEFLAGDHTVVIAHVERAAANSGASPLVFFRSAYHPGMLQIE